MTIASPQSLEPSSAAGEWSSPRQAKMDPSILKELVDTLTLANNNDSESQRLVTQRLQDLGNRRQDLVLYLLFVFTSADYEELMRQRAGLYLKQYCRTNIETMSPEHIATVLRLLVQSIRDANKVVRETSGTVLTFIIQKLGLPRTEDTIRGLANSLVSSTGMSTCQSL